MEKVLDTSELKALEALGGGTYSDFREVNGVVIGLSRFVYTTGILVGVSEDTMCRRRYCYEHYWDARQALEDWDGNGHPPGPWIKLKGVDDFGAPLDELGPGAS